MNLKKVKIDGYKCFGEPYEIVLSEKLSVLVGENGSGKSAIIDGIRLILQEDEFGRKGIVTGDFHKPFLKDSKPSELFRINAEFDNLSETEKVAFLPWSNLKGVATLTLNVENKLNNRERYKWNLWGGASRASAFEKELIDSISCIYLPPLRDSEAKLREGKGSRLARLLKNLNRNDIDKAEKEGTKHDIVNSVKEFNKSLSTNQNLAIYKANKLIRTRLQEALGSVFSQDTVIQFSEPDFNRIVESLRLLFFPGIGQTDGDLFRGLDENSLGFNNILYLASVLAELTNAPQPHEYLRILLIEEPEAHLHPQLQVRLLKYIEQSCEKSQIQAIITTHSPVLVSAASLSSIIRLSTCTNKPTAIRIDSTGLPEPSIAFLSRWLDATKSILFFAKGIILVEGIAEAMLVPELAKRCLKTYNEKIEIKGKSSATEAPNLKTLPATLEDAGVSVINMGGIYFRHFMQLFCNLQDLTGEDIPLYCAGITDQDPPEKRKICSDIEEDFLPTSTNKIKGNNPALDLIDEINKSKWARLYAGDLKTFEYDLAMQDGNLKCMFEVILKLWPSKTGPVRDSLSIQALKDWTGEKDENIKAKASAELLFRIEDSKVGKGIFSQALADKVKDDKMVFSVPFYIQSAIIWACGGDPDGLKCA